MVVFSGSLPPGFPVTEFTGLVRMARREGAITAVDTSGTALRAAARLGVDIVKPNREEAEALLGFKLSSKPAITKALHTLHGYGIKKVLISLGSKGLAAFDGKYEVLAKVPVVRNGMPVGCGDAALAGFIVALIDGKDLKTCADRAAACGAENMKTFLRRK